MAHSGRDGRRSPWGFLDVAPASPTVWRRVRLTVYPPGTSPAQRRALAFTRAWPMASAVAGMLVLVSTARSWPPLPTLAGILTVAVTVLAVARRVTAPLRAASRRVSVVTARTGAGEETYGDPVLLAEAAARLRALDAARRAGRVDPVRYELEWGRVYELLPARESLHPVGSSPRS